MCLLYNDGDGRIDIVCCVIVLGVLIVYHMAEQQTLVLAVKAGHNAKFPWNMEYGQKCHQRFPSKSKISQEWDYQIPCFSHACLLYIVSCDKRIGAPVTL